jgi:hypothetical protein
MFEHIESIFLNYFQTFEAKNLQWKNWSDKDFSFLPTQFITGILTKSDKFDFKCSSLKIVLQFR